MSIYSEDAKMAVPALVTHSRSITRISVEIFTRKIQLATLNLYCGVTTKTTLTPAILPIF